MRIMESIRDFISKCPYLDDFAQINVDYLHKDAISYSIQTEPSNPIIKKYINGDALRQLVFTFSSRESYGPNEILNIENSGFYEDFSSWIESESNIGNLPTLDNGKLSRKIEVLTPGYVFQTDIDRGQYQIQLRLIYYQVK